MWAKLSTLKTSLHKKRRLYWEYILNFYKQVSFVYYLYKGGDITIQIHRRLPRMSFHIRNHNLVTWSHIHMTAANLIQMLLSKVDRGGECVTWIPYLNAAAFITLVPKINVVTIQIRPLFIVRKHFLHSYFKRVYFMCYRLYDGGIGGFTWLCHTSSTLNRAVTTTYWMFYIMCFKKYSKHSVICVDQQVVGTL